MPDACVKHRHDCSEGTGDSTSLTERCQLPTPADQAPRSPAPWTPYLLINPGVVADRYQEMRRRLPDVRVHYAIKANPHPGLLSLLVGLGAGFEIASVAELDLAVAAGARPADLLYSNPVKPPAHVRRAHRRGVRRFAVDSQEELHKIAERAPGSSVYARLTVDDSSSAFPLSSKFGASCDAAVRLLTLAVEHHLHPYGITFHVGSECTDPTAWGRAIERSGRVLSELLRRGVRLTMLDIGGGFPSRYAEPVPGLAEIAPLIRHAIDALPYRLPAVIAEPGRYLVAESGQLVATVIGVTRRAGGRWAYLDVGGYNGLMEAVQTQARWPYPVSSSADSRGTPRVPFTLTGPSCDSTDTILHAALLPVDLKEGDTVRIGSAGAYTTCYAAPAFNGFPAPRTLIDPCG